MNKILDQVEESKTKLKELKELKERWGLDDHPYYAETIDNMEDFLLGKLGK